MKSASDARFMRQAARRDPASVRAALQRMNALAQLLDSSIPLPGGTRIGVDALLGVVPVVGDALGVVLSSWIVVEAARLGAPAGLLWRMGGNILVDGLIGLVPLAGDVFDAAWKANRRNLELLNRHFGQKAR